jgi:hypothetical protein
LAHVIEDEGIATTGISLVRENTAAMRPPRFLWVSFPLGRPLGVPGDAAFQRRVMLAALHLLEAGQGPVLEDYPEDIPVAETAEAQGAVSPIALGSADPATDDDLGALVQQEIDQLAPWHELAVNQRGRTTMGISGLEPREAGRFLARFLGDIPPTSYREDLSLGEALKLTTEDLKAYYQEAVTAQPGNHSIAALNHWLWRETALGRLLRTVQRLVVHSDDRSAQRIAQTALVPHAQQDA